MLSPVFSFISFSSFSRRPFPSYYEERVSQHGNFDCVPGHPSLLFEQLFCFFETEYIWHALLFFVFFIAVVFSTQRKGAVLAKWAKKWGEVEGGYPRRVKKRGKRPDVFRTGREWKQHPTHLCRWDGWVYLFVLLQLDLVDLFLYAFRITNVGRNVQLVILSLIFYISKIQLCYIVLQQ